jgi:DNA-binding response OmpR family regulator
MVHMLSAAWGLALEGVRQFGISAQREDYVRPDAWGALASNAASGRAQTSRTQRTVLIVEDDPELQRVMTEHVARMDVRVLTASHYAAALAHLESSTPDLACVDIGLPTESGYELCEYIRGPLGLSLLPIMVTSEFGSPEDMAYAEEAGANAFLVKPFSMPHLGANIAALLDGVWPSTAHILQLGP